MRALKTKINVNRHEREKNPFIKKVQNEMNALMEEGWELVGVHNIRLETVCCLLLHILCEKNYGLYYLVTAV